MASKAFFIGPYESGLETKVKPWLQPEDSFSLLRNAYVWRSRVKKRLGSRLFPWDDATTQQLGSRLRIAISGGAAVGITDGAGNATAVVPGALGELGQMFSIGTAMYSVTTVGVAQPMLETVATATATFDTTNGTYVFAGAPATTQIYWYPSLPVMGLPLYETIAINEEAVVGFDTRFSYERDATTGAWARAGTLAWTGDDHQFFWGTNYRGVTSSSYILYVVNNNRADSICYWDGTTFTRVAGGGFQTKLNNAAPIVAANFILQSARLIVTFKNTLIALNTLESVDDGAGNPVDRTFANRARWHAAAGPLSANAWMDDDPGHGGFINASTKEAIITARIFKDRLIVYFERSTWELVYTGNKVQPFAWQVIDDNIGAESTFSSILLDDLVLGVGQNGIHSCDGLHVKRIDEKIPDTVFKIHNGKDGVERVAGIRDFVNEIAYWTFPNSQHDTKYPDRMMVYNYKNDSWAFFDDSITAFGYSQGLTDVDLTWGEDHGLWSGDSSLWGSGVGQSYYRYVLAGNQQGFTFIMDNKLSRNAPALEITNIDITGYPTMILTVKNHNLTDFHEINGLLIENVQGLANGVDATSINDRVYIVSEVTDENTIVVIGDPDLAVTGTYTGGGTIARISNIEVKTKDFNFYTNDMRMAISRLDLDVGKTSAGLVFFEFYPSTSTLGIGKLENDGLTPSFQVETYPHALYPQEVFLKRLVRRIYPIAEGDSIRLQFYTDPLLYADGYADAVSNFTLHSMTFYASPTATR